MFFSVYTLGCKLNQLETEAIADSFRRAGFTITKTESQLSLNTGEEGEKLSSGRESPDAGIIVVNTCTVTSMAEQKARRVIRKMLRDYPGASILVTGCYAQLDGAVLAALEEEPSGRLFVVPGDRKDRIMDLPGFIAGADHAVLPELIRAWIASQKESDSPGSPFRFRPEKFAFHSRGFIKIQDGCDRRCSYCRVSLARGKSRSLEAGKILEELLAMEERGIAEAVLTGVNISQYRDSGHNAPEEYPKKSPQVFPAKLPGLLEFLLKETSRIRIRLSSLEPDELNDDFIKVLADPRIRPHFHLSLQSGSAAILAKMARPYTPEHVEKAAALLRSVRHDPFLACDIIAGFPGETEAEFEKTLRLCETIGFAWIHAFPYSRRPGTAAFHFPGRVSERDAAERVEQLSGLARKGRREYIERWEGKEVEAVIEAGKNLLKGFARGLSENYLKLQISLPMGIDPGALIKCRIGKASGQARFDTFAEKTNISSI